MHSVSRATEPAILRQCRENYLDWHDLRPAESGETRAALKRDFNSLCAFCESKCSASGSNALNSATIEHFYPRACAVDGKDFSGKMFDWDNLLYACWRCNQMKGNLWPVRNALFGYAEGFVNPNLGAYRENVQEFFTFDNNGVIAVSDSINITDVKYRIICDTLEILNLNSDPITHDSNEYNAEQLRSVQRIQKEENPLPKQRQVALRGFIATFNHAHKQNHTRLLHGLRAGKVPFHSYIMWWLQKNHPYAYARIMSLND